jgi:hypothetical protein
MITTVIDVTTDAVVPWPRLCVGLDAQAEVAGRQRDQHAEHHAQAEPQVGTRHGIGQLAQEEHEADVELQARRPCRRSAIRSVHATSSGMAMASAITRGMISRKPCEMPITHRIEFLGHPHHADLRGDGRAGRPAIRIAASTGPSSRITAMPRMLTMNVLAPNIRSWLADR